MTGTQTLEALIDYIEDVFFTRVTRILADESKALDRCEKIFLLLLGFCEKNPGLTRILTGEGLAGETERLRKRVIRLFERLETQLKQLLREAEIKEGLRTKMTVGTTANLLLAAAEGRIVQYVRSEFKRQPTDGWAEQWLYLSDVIFK